jgi:hypothetical protein
LSGISETIVSVVRTFLAIDAAFCSAERVTIAGSMMPSVDDLAADGVQSLAVLGLAHVVDDDRALKPGDVRDLAKWLFERAEHDLRARFLVLVLEPSEHTYFETAG